MNKILFLTAPYGYGHIKPTNVLYKEFKKNGHEIKTYDIIQEWNNTISSVSKKIYQSMYLTGFRRLYQFWYWATDQVLIGDLTAQIMKYVNSKKLKQAIEEYRPDAIVCMFPSWPLYKLLEKYKINTLVYTVVTDFYMHKLWYHKDLKKIFIANEWTLENINFNIKNDVKDKFFVTGIPIEDNFENIFQKNLKENKIHNNILLLAGSAGVNKEYLTLAQELYKRLNKEKITLICGNNKNLFQKAKRYENERFRVLGFCDNMPYHYQNSDLVVTKSGGNTVSELAALAKPAVFYNPLYGQEMENAMFFSKYNVSKIAMNKEQAIQIILELFKKRNKINIMRENYKKIFIPYASKNITKIIEEDLNCIELKK